MNTKEYFNYNNLKLLPCDFFEMCVCVFLDGFLILTKDENGSDIILSLLYLTFHLTIWKYLSEMRYEEDEKASKFKQKYLVYK